MNGGFDAAATIFYFMVLDGLDGRVARLTNTKAGLVKSIDSLSDMVAFGWLCVGCIFPESAVTLGNLGWIRTFIYVAARRSGWLDSTYSDRFRG